MVWKIVCLGGENFSTRYHCWFRYSLTTANSVSSNIGGVGVLPASAIGLALITVVGNALVQPTMMLLNTTQKSY